MSSFQLETPTESSDVKPLTSLSRWGGETVRRDETMKHLGKRGLALLLTVCLLFGALPAMPAAAEGDESTVGLTRAALAVEV